MYECVNGALQLKDAITRFSEDDMELDGRINGKDGEDTSHGEVRGIGEEMVHLPHPHSFLFPSMFFF